MSEEKLGLARLCRSFELASLEKGYVKKALDAYFCIKTLPILYQNVRRFMAKRTAFPYKTQILLCVLAQNAR
jgi:hypothetical protein